MRTLKKTLCLVLALVMMLGLCAINVGATAFTDDNEIGADYKEAVEVVSAIGVINGKGDGSSFDPKGTLTRVQGSYLITYLLKADTGATATRFNDVNREDVGVVEWMAANKIADGRDDAQTIFDPNSTMTGKEFAKWLLTSLGYDAERETLTGPYWEGGVRILTAKIGLSKGIDNYDQNAPITREQAAQMCLNALEADMVEYGEGRLNSGAFTVNLGATPIESKTGKDYTGATSGDLYDTIQLCEMYHPQLTKNTNAVSVNAASAKNLNRPVESIWSYRGETLYEVMATPVAVFTGSTKADAVTSALSGYYILDDNNSTEYTFNDTRTRESEAAISSNLTVAVNGAAESDLASASAQSDKEKFVISSGSITITKATTSSMIASLTENGRVVELYAAKKDKPNQITDIVVNCFTVAKVDKVETKNGTTTYKFVGAGTGSDVAVEAATYADTPEENTLITEAALEEGAIVVLTCNGGGLEAKATADNRVYAYETEKRTGTQTRYTSDGKVTIDGTVYTVATGVATKTDYTDNTLPQEAFKDNKEVDYYLFNLGGSSYLVHAKAVTKDESTGKYAFIIDASGKYNDGGFDEDEPVIKVRAILSDGTWGDFTVETETVKANSKNRTKVYVADTENNEYALLELDEGGEKFDYTVIKNTRILVVGGVDPEAVEAQAEGGGELSGWTAKSDKSDNKDNENGLYINGSAQILMSDLYGYVYEYSLNGDKITLKPLGNNGGDNKGYESDPAKYGNNYDGKDKKVGTVYAGQTVDALEKGVQSYAAAVVAVQGNATGDTSIAKYGKPEGNGDGTGSKDTVVIGSNATIIKFNTDTKKVDVETGRGNLPVGDKAEVMGYYAAKATDKHRLNAEVVFMVSGKKIESDPVQSKDYIFVNADKTKTTEETGDNTKVYFMAWDMKGKEVTAYATKADFDDGKIKTGLYYLKDTGEIGDNQLVAAEGMAEEGITAKTPYFALGKITGDGSHVNNDGSMKTIDSENETGNKTWTLGNVTSLNGGNIEKDGIVVVLKTSGNELTGDIEAIFTY